jgi:hypothetical protein
VSHQVEATDLSALATLGIADALQDGKARDWARKQMAFDYICAADAPLMHKGEEKAIRNPRRRCRSLKSIPCGTIQRRGQDGLAKPSAIERQRISSQSFKASLGDNPTLVRTNGGKIVGDTMNDLAKTLGLDMSLRSALIGERKLVPAPRFPKIERRRRKGMVRRCCGARCSATRRSEAGPLTPCWGSARRK